MSKGNGLVNGGKSGNRTPLATAAFRHSPEVLERQLQGLATETARFLKSAKIDSGSITPGMNEVFRNLSEKL